MQISQKATFKRSNTVLSLSNTVTERFLGDIDKTEQDYSHLIRACPTVTFNSFYLFKCEILLITSFFQFTKTFRKRLGKIYMSHQCGEREPLYKLIQAVRFA